MKYFKRTFPVKASYRLGVSGEFSVCKTALSPREAWRFHQALILLLSVSMQTRMQGPHCELQMAHSEWQQTILTQLLMNIFCRIIKSSLEVKH